MRALATHTAVITLIGLGLAAPASAAPGDTGTDNRSDTATTAQVEASTKGSEQSQTRSGNSTTKASTKASGGSSTSTATKGSTQSEGKGLDDDRRTQTGEQPVSTADQNTAGANGQCSDTSEDSGDYCGTDRTNKASGNGEGDGAAVGKPYQAHKGKADNKNPPGQVDNTRDNGYECDGNKGIAKGNPAHTSCVTTTTTVTPPTVTPPGPPTVIPPGIGGVDTEVPPVVTPPVVKGVETLKPPAGVELYRPPAQAPEAAPAQALPGAAVLPATGATPAMTALSALAFGMLALGSGVLLYRRVTA